MKLRRLHRRTEAVMALMAVVAFISGAGLDAPSVLPAIVMLAAVALLEPGITMRRRLEPLFKAAAVLLTIRAANAVAFSPEDVVLPMVDLLLMLLVAEVYRQRDVGNDARVYALTFALLVAAAAYRPGALFAVAFVAYMATATVSLMVGHLLQSIERRPISDVTLRTKFLVQSAVFSGVALLIAATVFLAFPRVTRGWVSRGLPATGGVIGFSDRISLADHGGRLYPNPELVLRVQFPEGRPADLNDLHWRGRSYDHFDGALWSSWPGRWMPQGGDSTRRRTGRLVQRIAGSELPGMNVLFGLKEIGFISPDDPRLMWRRLPNGDFMHFGSGGPAYTVYSFVSKPTQAQLDADADTLVWAVRSHLQLPELTPRMRQLADSLAAGHTTTAQKVAAVLSYLEPFTYTIELPRSARETGLDYFLFERREGHCEYFSSAMAILLRAMGVPTRNVNGFLGGEWNAFGNFLAVTQNQAHSWVEVWYPHYGWVEYDPTPASLTGLAQQSEPWWQPLRAFTDGLDYRWNRWVLDYDIRTQLGVLQRVSAAFRPERDGATAVRPDVPWLQRGTTRTTLLAVAAFFTLLLLRRSITNRRASPAARESAAYMKLRRAYEKRGYPAAGVLPPLAFSQKLSIDDAPGAVHAAEAVTLYTRARFGGEKLSDMEFSALRAAVTSAVSHSARR